MTNYKEKFEKMKVAGKLAAQTLDMLTDYIKPGVSTEKIARLSWASFCFQDRGHSEQEPDLQAMQHSTPDRYKRRVF